MATGLGSVAATAAADGEVDVLLRPGDLSLTPTTGDGNGAIVSAQYEGETWLYRVELDADIAVQVRANRANRLEPGSRVTVAVNSAQPLATFKRGD